MKSSLLTSKYLFRVKVFTFFMIYYILTIALCWLIYGLIQYYNRQHYNRLAIEYQQKQKRFAKRVVRTPRPELVRSPREDVIVSSPYRGSLRALDAHSPYTRPPMMESVVQKRVDPTPVQSTPIYSGASRTPSTPMVAPSVSRTEPVLSQRIPRPVIQTTPETTQDDHVETRVDQVKKHQPTVSSPLATDAVLRVHLDHRYPEKKKGKSQIEKEKECSTTTWFSTLC
jgi:cell division protein FtsN